VARAVRTDSIDPETVKEAALFIGERLREDDRLEVAATAGPDVDPALAVLESWQLSTASWLILDDTGLPIGIFGVAPHTVPQLGVAWLLGTDGMADSAFSIAFQTRHYVRELHKEYPILWATVDARNELSMAWLEKAGFQITNADPAHGPEDRLFLEYTRTA